MCFIFYIKNLGIFLQKLPCLPNISYAFVYNQVCIVFGTTTSKFKYQTFLNNEADFCRYFILVGILLQL